MSLVGILLVSLSALLIVYVSVVSLVAIHLQDATLHEEPGDSRKTSECD
jgi:hypothetical protein